MYTFAQEFFAGYLSVRSVNEQSWKYLEKGDSNLEIN